MLSATLGLTGLAAVTSPVAVAADTAPYEVTIPAPASPVPPQPVEYVLSAGTGLQIKYGEYMMEQGWRNLATGRITPMSGCTYTPDGRLYLGDQVACLDLQGTDVRAEIHDPVTGTSVFRDRPADHQWLDAMGADRLLTYTLGSDTSATVHLLGFGPDAPADLAVRLPGKSDRRPQVLAFDATGAVLSYWYGGTESLGLLDFGTGAFDPLPVPDGGTRNLSTSLGAEHVLMYRMDQASRALVVPRGDADGTWRTVSLPGTEPMGYGMVAVLGNWAIGVYHVGAYQRTRPLLATDLTTGATRDVGIAVGPDSMVLTGSTGLYVYGGSDISHWGVQRISLDAAGLPSPTRVQAMAPDLVERSALQAANGRIRVQQEYGARDIQGYELSLGAPHQAVPTTKCALHDTPACGEHVLTGDGRAVGLMVVDGPPAAGGTEPCWSCAVQVTVAPSAGDARSVVLTYPNRLSNPELVSASGRLVHFLADEGGYRRSYVADIETGRTIKAGNVRASLWGNRIWTASWTDDQVSAIDARTGSTVETIDLGTGCVNQEIEVRGQWIHASCGSSRWVYDRDRKTRIVLPRVASEQFRVGLGDGFLLQLNADTGALSTIDFRSGTPVTQSVGTVARYNPDHVALDRYTGAVASIDTARAIRVTGLGGVTSRLTAIDADTPAVNIKSGAWKPRWWLSKPGSSWTLTLRNKASGKSVRTLTGGEARGIVAPSWDGKDAAGKYVANGAYTWSLTVKPADGQGADLVASGGVAVSGAGAVWRDMAGDDGFGDVLAMDTAGAMSLYRGTGTGGVSARIAGSGNKFATGSSFVPVGDLNGDRCADVYVRVGSELRAYRPGCGKVVTASSPYTLVGSGWSGYDVLTSPGDVNGDGYADIVARQASTGDMYFYAGTASHVLKARVKIAADWRLYKRLVGAGDLNGDGRGDLLGVDAAGVLWRYFGTSTGGVAPRVKVGGGWGVYSALVGVGDLSGDGRTDLLARTTDGKLYRYSSTGTGAYGGRVLIGTGGWNGFKGLF
ncbi:FG-GAP-like repeat-containing protein [Streptomyces hydrogenans]